MIKYITFCSFDNESEEHKREFKTKHEAYDYIKGYINDRCNPFRLYTITKARFEKWEYKRGKEPRRKFVYLFCLGSID